MIVRHEITALTTITNRLQYNQSVDDCDPGGFDLRGFGPTMSLKGVMTQGVMTGGFMSEHRPELARPPLNQPLVLRRVVVDDNEKTRILSSLYAGVIGDHFHTQGNFFTTLIDNLRRLSDIFDIVCYFSYL